MNAQAVYEFGDIRVDPGRAQLLRGGRVVAVEPKTFDVLRFLLENRDRLVTKEELLDSVWAGTFVTPNALTRSVAQLRKALGDDAHEAKYVETVARRGYRFIAPVTVVSEAAGTVVAAGGSAPAVNQRPSIAFIAMGAVVAALAVSLLAVLIVRRSPAPQPKSDSTPSAAAPLDRVTTRLGYNGRPSLSPDGSLVAYASDESGSLEIHVTGLAPGARDFAITNDGGQNTEPAWSPDGRWIAFHSGNRHGIWIVPSTGGTPAQISDFGSQPAWSPDSSSLVFTSDAGGTAAQSQLWTVARDGSALHPLTRIGVPAGGHREPIWAHNGNWVIFSVYEGLFSGSLCAVDVRSGRVTTILKRSSSLLGLLPRDDALLCGSINRKNDARIERIDLNPATAQPLGPPALVRELPAFPEGLSVGTDGTVVLGLAAFDTNFWALDLADGHVAGDPVRLTDSSVRLGKPTYSKDGRIAFVQTEGGSPTTWIMNGDGSGREPVIIDRMNGGPQWAPDGKRLLVRYDPKPPENNFWWVDLATRRMSATPMKGSGFENVTLSPRGDEIAYHTIDAKGVLNVWTQSIDGTRKTQVTFDPEAASYAAWSPDGQWLAVELKRNDATQIGVVGRNGGPIRILTSARGQSWPHSWSPDGRWIAFAGERDGVWNIYAVSPNTLETRQLTRFTAVDGYVRYPAWSPDGRRVVFERAILTAGIWKMKLDL